jgi:dienelactone hydrolase
MYTIFARGLALLVLAQVAPAEAPAVRSVSPAEARKAFVALLDRPKVPLDVQSDNPAKAVDGIVAEHLTFATEKKADGTIERVPTLIVRPEKDAGKRPTVILLHGTGGNKDGMRPWLVELAKRGFVAVAIDARHHGDRSGGKKGAAAYIEAITRAWRAPEGKGQEHPFYYDTCWDLWRLVDYLASRADVDPKRIGMLGISMGGIETWLAAAADDRIAVAVPAIGVQSFRWSLENGHWQGRAKTIGAAHDAAAKDLGESQVNARVCRTLWNKVIPGMLGPFDCPSMIRLFAGRPLLILNGELDPNCPIEGAELAFASARAAYQDANESDRLRIMVAQGVAHAVTEEQRQAALDWFVRWLKP